MRTMAVSSEQKEICRTIMESAPDGQGAESMKLYLDDRREPPEGWVRVRWPEEAIELLKTGQVTDLSLDHDLGDDARGTGYDVVLWIEEAVAMRAFMPPKMIVHSANSPARAKMEAGLDRIRRYMAARREIQ